MVSGSTVAVAAAVLVAAGGAVYYLSRPAAASSGTHGTLEVEGSESGTSVSPTTLLSWTVAGVTPGALIQFGLDTAPSGETGFYVADTATADMNGNASGSYQLVTGSNDQPGTTIYALAYDTAVGTIQGYSNAVAITFT